ncbi:hypothetical protein [Cyclobacterium sp. SYSU L10401]|uniref:hypothetical protein n=1 Tax=Cyclobacterium sp. SYSU L10401 TaxID=2678657 RepID=UPI0013D2F0FD|nr:hypothetical protein [Cyclobacterium sp. SYSU L10401]
MWENYINEINATLVRFFNKDSPDLPTYYDIQELVAIGKDSGERSLILSHLSFALDDLKANWFEYFDPEHWDKSENYDWVETEFLGHFDLFNNLDALFEDVKKIGSPLNFEMYIDRYCRNPEENQNLNRDDLIPPNDNKFNTMPIEDVRSFFKVLITKKNRDGKFWMNESEFETFIKRSFGLQKNLDKPIINIGRMGKYALVKLFWKYYDLCQKEDIAPNRLRKPYLELLKNAFDTKKFDDLRIDNFKKSRSDYDWGL